MSAPSGERLTLREMARRHAAGEASIVETVQTTLERIAALDGDLQSLTSVDAEGALERARRLELGESPSGRSSDANLGPGRLFGVPFVAKANLCLEGAETHCGSQLLAGWRAPYTATALERVLAEGAIPIGMAQMDEFGMGSSGEHSSYGIAKNPWSSAHTPGGSSSGCAAAVGAGLVPFALGSDTGGSVRQPAAFCGVTGLKPTYGRVSRYGLVAFGSSLDCIAPLAQSAADCALLLEVISGRDERDATALPIESYYGGPLAVADGLAGLKIGTPLEYMDDAGLDEDVKETIAKALETLRSLGAQIVPCQLPHTALALSAYYVIATAEASSNLARFDGLRFGQRAVPAAGSDATLAAVVSATRAAGFGPEVKRRILLGTFALSSGYYDAWYERALRVRRLVRDDFELAFEQVDLLVGPTSPTPAFRLGERTQDPVAMYAADTLTVPASLAGLPAISVPAGQVTRSGVKLPVGLQLIGPALEDGRVLRAAQLFQKRTQAQAGSQPA